MKQWRSAMPAKKATKTANVSVNLYDGEFQLIFDCGGVEACRYALCSMMPPDGSEECIYREYGSCVNPPAQCAALETLRNRLAKEMKKRSEEANQ